MQMASSGPATKARTFAISGEPSGNAGATSTIQRPTRSGTKLCVECGCRSSAVIVTIGPAIQAMQKRGFDVVGPLSGDTVFHYALKGDFDAVVAMYHDQGLAPLKAVAFDSGINWTLGLPFIRTSPDHGTAYKIAGKGIANPGSMIAAIRLAKQLASRKGGTPISQSA